MTKYQCFFTAYRQHLANEVPLNLVPVLVCTQASSWRSPSPAAQKKPLLWRPLWPRSRSHQMHRRKRTHRFQMGSAIHVLNSCLFSHREPMQFFFKYSSAFSLLTAICNPFEATGSSPRVFIPFTFLAMGP